MTFDVNEHSHLRFNALTGDWIMVSPHRTKRPWQGKTETMPPDLRPAYDPTCYLCAGNLRANGEANPLYTHTFVFDNDFAAVQKEVPQGNIAMGDLLKAESVQGICRVICFSPRHDLTLPQLTKAELVQVIETWQNEFENLITLPQIQYVQIFENKGEIMGCSNPHPHGQIWATGHTPLEIQKESTQQAAYYAQHGETLLTAYGRLEREQKERLVFENEHFMVVVPFWATWPFETLLFPKVAQTTISHLTATQKSAFAEALKVVTTRYDNLFKVSFPYSAGLHQAPKSSLADAAWHWHLHFYPPLLRSATVKKFMVGYEMLATPQRDITPEAAAAQLRACPDLHYLSQ